jgi:hypothetical protein
MGEAAITFWPDLQAFMQHPGVVLRHWPLHERSQCEHADAAGNGEEGDDGRECVHEGRGIESTLQQEPDPASIVKHYYKANWIFNNENASILITDLSCCFCLHCSHDKALVNYLGH